ncbi:hypothetical protein, partial [Neisseria sp. P0019.S002]|uniref:hypothetical protein n=1 Tax=Neisseria sp. P0019.S002 TaxID=3436798 RepID=UPI003F81076D
MWWVGGLCLVVGLVGWGGCGGVGFWWGGWLLGVGLGLGGLFVVGLGVLWWVLGGWVCVCCGVWGWVVGGGGGLGGFGGGWFFLGVVWVVFWVGRWWGWGVVVVGGLLWFVGLWWVGGVVGWFFGGWVVGVGVCCWGGGGVGGGWGGGGGGGGVNEVGRPRQPGCW